MNSSQYPSSAASLFAGIAREMPNFCLAPLMSTFDGKTAEVIGVKYGERGYYPTSYGRQTREWIAERNQSMGIDPATAGAYSLCSLFGNWGNFESVRKHIQEALDKKVLCTCLDPVHPGDDESCPRHGKEAAHWVGGAE